MPNFYSNLQLMDIPTVKPMVSENVQGELSPKKREGKMHFLLPRKKKLTVILELAVTSLSLA